MCEADVRCQAFLAKAWPGVPVWPDVRTFSLGIALGNGRSSGELAAAPSGHGSTVESDAGERVADAGRIGRERRPPGEKSGKESGGWEQAQHSSLGANPVYLLTAGVPCQPASRAGKQGGASDDRWLWPEAVKVFAAIRPAWGLFENPPGIGDVGLAGILSDVEAQGYATRVFSVGACALGAPHRRMRYWIVCRRLADSPEQYRTEQGCAPLIGGRVAPFGMENTRGTDREPEAGEQGARPQSKDGTGAFGSLDGSSPWSNSVLLSCADGKVRRAPDSSVELVDGRSVDIIETLAKEGWPHRSILGALGNSIVWPVAATIISAMIRSENESNL